tara:strand:- start:178 stop:369 length:192 start_codon:yes stop_codon:yes gene_type:complete
MSLKARRVVTKENIPKGDDVQVKRKRVVRGALIRREPVLEDVRRGKEQEKNKLKFNHKRLMKL